MSLSSNGPRTGLGWLLGGLAATGLTAVVFTLLGVVALPRFATAFAEAGVALPALTRLFQATFLVAWAGPPLVVLAWWRRAYSLAGLIGGAALLVGTPIALFATYVPMFQLASLY